MDENPRSAMIFCNDVFRLVSFLIEALDERGRVNIDRESGQLCVDKLP